MPGSADHAGNNNHRVSKLAFVLRGGAINCPVFREQFLRVDGNERFDEGLCDVANGDTNEQNEQNLFPCQNVDFSMSKR